jgi:hypothetical protein
MVRPIDPNTPTFGVTSTEIPPERSFRLGGGTAVIAVPTAAVVVHARLNERATPMRSWICLPAPAPTYQTPGEKYPALV